eukprot:1192415-Prorocentrum_minimum.AAC.6
MGDDLQESCFGPKTVLCTWDNPNNRMPSKAELRNAAGYMGRAWHNESGKVLFLDDVVDKPEGATGKYTTYCSLCDIS